METSLKNVIDKEKSIDEVDSILVSNNSTDKKPLCKSCRNVDTENDDRVTLIECNSINNNNLIYGKPTTTKDQSIEVSPKSSTSTFNALNIFNLSKLQKTNGKKDKEIDKRRKHVLGQRLIRSSSIAKLFGNKLPLLKSSDNSRENVLRKSHSVHEKFSKKSEESYDNEMNFSSSGLNDNNDLISKSISSINSSQSWNYDIHHKKPNNFEAIKTITRNFGKLLRKNYDSASISTPDPEYKVSYLGNVLTAWSKGESCIEKPLATLWKNYIQNKKPEVLMRLRVCPSGLKATTRQHGLTEYWSHRITFCAAPATYPKVFCWIYRHEGRKMKHELRCHAVICTKDAQCQEINLHLKGNLENALREFKKDKINKQNARLGLAHASEENPSMPRRKILLSTGAQNYRPPLERSKSAPKLFAIEEMVDEEDDDLDEDSKLKRTEEKLRKDLIKTCCKEDHLYPSITLGRRRCRRGHSIRRPRLYGDATSSQFKLTNNRISSAGISTKDSIQRDVKLPKDNDEMTRQNNLHSLEPVLNQSSKKSGSDEDFEVFLLNQNYNTNDFLAGDVLSYFDRKLNDSSSEIIPDSVTVTVSMSDLLNSDYTIQDQQRNSISMNDLNNYQFSYESGEEDNELLSTNKIFDQDLVLETLIRQSQDTFGEFDSPDQSISSEQSNIPAINECRNMFLFKRNFLTGDEPKIQLDNDEGSSIASGCDINTSNTHNSTSTLVMSDNELKKSEDPPIFRSGSVQDRVRNFEMLASKRNLNSNFSNLNRNQANVLFLNNHRELCPSRKLTLTPVDNSLADGRDKNRDDESEMSDESGFVEFQDLSLKSVYA